MRGRAGLSAPGPDSRLDGADDFPIPVLDLAVGKPQDTKALRPEPGVPDRIPLCIMKGTVSLDDEAMPQADEVHHIGTDDHLTPELQAFEPPVAQDRPELALGGRGRAPHPVGQALKAIIGHGGATMAIRHPAGDTFSRKGRRIKDAPLTRPSTTTASQHSSTSPNRRAASAVWASTSA